MNNYFNNSEQRKAFTLWILSNWDHKYHNFSITEDGEYFYTPMEDAWGVWLGARDNEAT